MTKTYLLVEKALTNAEHEALSPLNILAAIEKGGSHSSIPSVYRAIKRMLKTGAIVSVPVPDAAPVYTVKTNPAIKADPSAFVRPDGSLCGFTAHVASDGRVNLARVDQLRYKALLRCYYYPGAENELKRVE